MDTVFNKFMRPVFSNEPAEVRRRLRAAYSDDWVKVCVGETGQIVTITEYLYEEKFTDVLTMLKELLRKQDLPMYRRNPERLDIHLNSTAKKIIERVLGES